MRVTMIACLGVALAGVSGCGEREAEAAVAAALGDPGSAKFQSVERYDEQVCGEVNGAGNGGYARFVYRPGDAPQIERRAAYDETQLAEFDRTCALVASGGSALDRTVCDQARQAREALEAQRNFDALWKESCG